MTDEQMNAVDAHLDNFVASEAPEGLSEDAGKIFDIGQLWAEVRPVVESIHNFFLTPRKWKTALQKMIDKFDALYPQT